MKVIDKLVSRIGKAFMADVKRGAQTSLDRVGNYLIAVVCVCVIAIGLAVYLAVRHA